MWVRGGQWRPVLSRVPTRRGRRPALAALACAVLAVAACGTDSSDAVVLQATVATAPPQTPAPPTTPSPAPPTPLPATPAPPPVVTPAPATAAPVDCAATELNRMDPAARVGQLLMVGVPSTDPSAGAALAAIRDQHAGGVVLFGGGWNGRPMVARTTAAVQAAGRADRGIGVLVSGNQEGGQQGSFQAFYGDGFSPIPAAPQQGATGVDALTAQARTWAGELRAAGINVDLAPVDDAVPAGGAAWLQGRQLGGDPASVAAHGAAVVRGLQSAGVGATLKHFPGLEWVPKNTDFHDTDIADSVTGPDSPYLEPFRAGIAAGAGLVMVSTATYQLLDAGTPAAFSPAVVTGLLRQRLGFAGVVISDDLGGARSVAAVPTGERAVRFVAAGGDIVLTIVPGQAATMESALVARMGADPAFAAKVAASALRVLHAKAVLGLIPGCSG